MDNTSLQFGQFLSTREWNYFITFTYRFHISPKQNRNYMNQVFILPGVKEMFWSFENGNHTHAIIQTSEEFSPIVVRRKWSKIGRISIDEYDTEYNSSNTFSSNNNYSNGTGCPYYITKSIGYSNTDYDYFLK